MPLPPKSAGPMTGPLWQALFIGTTLLLLSTVSWFAIVFHPSRLPEPDRNPRRSQFAELWRSVHEGQSLAEVISVMGTPDEERQQFERVPDCSCPCDGSCDTYYTCLTEYEWVSTLEPGSADLYLLCTDEAQIVRRTSTGGRMRFDIVSTDEYSLAGIAAWAFMAAVLAIPLAIALRLRRRSRPRRTSEVS